MNPPLMPRRGRGAQILTVHNPKGSKRRCPTMQTDEEGEEPGEPNNPMERVRTVRSPEFRQFYATSVYGNMTPVDCRITFYSEDISVKDEQRNSEEVEVDGIVRLLKAQVFMSPYSAKLMSIWLSQQVKEYEQEYGEIKLDPGNVKRVERPIAGYM